MCPSCRQQRRLSWRNETKLYRRDCSLTGKSVVSIYSPDKAFITYNQDDWWSDAYNPCDYGRDFDFSKTFFEQFADLQRVVPRITILNGFGENADYGNHSYHNKNSYFVCSCGYVEDCYYCVTMSDCKNCVDCDKVMSSENCYDAIDSRHCYGCMHILNCMNCSDILWGEDLEGCSHCIGCKGVKNGSYYILNEEVEKAAFSEIQKKLEQDIGYRREMYERFLKLKLQVPSKQLQIIHSEKVEQSDKIENSENVSHCFDCINARDMKYCTEMMMEYTADTSYDYDVWGENASQMYEVHCSGAAKNILFSNVVW
ncbi:MAG: hypothetical protein H6767_03610 [Candidatus Peribacteria bacterium]|nr:MAG: hypothetical protein H6767_03610 [Candidatus Peribacteria bacterium]